jgi:Beta propeller domain
VAGGKLHAVAAGGLELLGSLELEGWGHQLLLRGERLLVIAQSAPLGSAQTRVAPGLMDEVTELSEVDVSDPAAMRVVRTERIRGSHLSSRLSGATARIVVWTRPRALLEPAFRSRLRGWLPRRVSRRARGGRPVARRAAPCGEVLRPALYSGIDVLTVLTVDLAKGLPAVDSDAILAGGQTVYASPSALYVGTPEWAPEPESADMPPERALTTVHKFDASEPDRTHYRASGRLPGYLLNQFSLSEHEGVLRAASTDSPVWWSGRERREPESFVTTLAERDGRLYQLGQVGGLGRTEQIHAVRFLAERGYVVTFRQVDPLYTVDLSNPERPRVAGELKIRGYSAYLHPLAGDLLLGVGQDATEGGATLGTQLSLFDVSDPARPARLFQHAIADASSEAEWDHHAFLFWAPQKLAVLPLTSYGAGARSFSGAVGFTVDRAAGIAEAGRAEHSADVRRSLVLDGQLFTISDAGIEANSMPGLAEQRHLAFP